MRPVCPLSHRRPRTRGDAGAPEPWRRRPPPRIRRVGPVTAGRHRGLATRSRCLPPVRAGISGHSARTGSPSPPGVPSRRLPPEPESVALARRFVRSVLDGVPPDSAHTAELLVGELVTNAVIHARTEIEVRAWTTEGRVQVRVTDRRPDRGLVPHDRHPYACTGRGLTLVEDLATSHGVHSGGDRKTVWFEVWPEAPAPPASAWETVAPPGRTVSQPAGHRHLRLRPGQGPRGRPMAPAPLVGRAPPAAPHHRGRRHPLPEHGPGLLIGMEPGLPRASARDPLPPRCSSPTASSNAAASPSTRG
ncbi:ATP-binding protein [Streptomyces sp. NPDC101171]|uniref:ATP-binding protein n=1 Tax=Streptomyces sp. NPDC101171 TaxID=3366122 RepID=UPI00381BA4A6